MDKLQKILNRTDFPEAILRRLRPKKTEEGALSVLSSYQTFKEMYPTHETVFKKIFETMRLKANDKCQCGYRISMSWKRIYDKKKKRYKMQFRCKMCKKGHNVYSPLSFTPLKGAHKPLHQIMEIIFKLINDKRGVSASQIEREYGWKYDTSLDVLHKIRTWMGLSVGLFKFDGNIVECDETYVDIPTGMGRNVVRTRGLGSEGKRPVFAIVQRNPRQARAYSIDDANRATIKPIIEANVSRMIPVYTDGHSIYKYLTDAGYFHSECNHSQKQYVVNHTHTNTVESFNGLLKGQLGVTHKGVSKEHLQKYLDEASFRFSFTYAFDALEALFDALPPMNSKGIIVPNVNLN
jgi:transposase